MHGLRLKYEPKPLGWSQAEYDRLIALLTIDETSDVDVVTSHCGQADVCKGPWKQLGTLEAQWGKWSTPASSSIPADRSSKNTTQAVRKVKVPSASSLDSGKQIAALKASPKTKGSKKKKQHRHLEVYVQQYSGDAFRFGEQYVENAPMYQVQIVQEGSPSIPFRSVTYFQEFLHNNGIASLQEFERQWNAKFICTNCSPEGNPDVDDVGYKAYRTAWYISAQNEEMQNFLSFLDSFFVFRARQENMEPWPEVHYALCSGVCYNVDVQRFELPSTFHYDVDEFSVLMTEAHPPYMSRRMLIAHITIEDSESVSIVFHGDTWRHRHGFMSASIPGDYGEDGSEYFRYLTSTSVATPQEQDNLVEVMCEIVARKTVMVVKVIGIQNVHAAPQEFLRKLTSKAYVVERHYTE